MAFELVWFGLFFGVPGLILFFLSVRYYLEARASLVWPSVIGTVISSVVATGRGGEGGTVYQAIVTYSYDVGNTTYQSKRRRIGIQNVQSGGAGAAKGAQKIVNRYPKGSKVNVFYNPTNPVKAVLEPGLKKTWWTLLVVSIALSGFLLLSFPLDYFPDLIFFTASFTVAVVGLLWFFYNLNKQESQKPYYQPVQTTSTFEEPIETVSQFPAPPRKTRERFGKTIRDSRIPLSLVTEAPEEGVGLRKDIKDAFEDLKYDVETLTFLPGGNVEAKLFGGAIKNIRWDVKPQGTQLVADGEISSKISLKFRLVFTGKGDFDFLNPFKEIKIHTSDGKLKESIKQRTEIASALHKFSGGVHANLSAKKENLMMTMVFQTDPNNIRFSFKLAKDLVWLLDVSLM